MHTQTLHLLAQLFLLTDAIAYRQRILDGLKKAIAAEKTALSSSDAAAAAALDELEFIPLMTLYLTDKTTPEEIVAAKKSGAVVAVKLYPAGQLPCFPASAPLSLRGTRSEAVVPEMCSPTRL